MTQQKKIEALRSLIESTNAQPVLKVVENTFPQLQGKSGCEKILDDFLAFLHGELNTLGVARSAKVEQRLRSLTLFQQRLIKESAKLYLRDEKLKAQSE